MYQITIYIDPLLDKYAPTKNKQFLIRIIQSKIIT